MVTFNQLFFPDTLSSDFVMQTLGAVVQTYASILALGGAFYLFMLERNQMEFRYEKERIERLIRGFAPYVSNHIPEYYENTLEKGFDWLNDQLIQLGRQRTVNFESVRTFPEYRELQYSFPKYELLKKKRGRWTFKLFFPVIGVSSILLILSLILMYFISQSGISVEYNLAFTALMTISFLGFFYLLWAVRDMMKISSGEMLDIDKDSTNAENDSSP